MLCYICYSYSTKSFYGKNSRKLTCTLQPIFLSGSAGLVIGVGTELKGYIDNGVDSAIHLYTVVNRDQNRGMHLYTVVNRDQKRGMRRF